MDEDDFLAPYREQAVICLLEDAVQLIDAHAKLHKRTGTEAGEAGMDVIGETESETNGAETVGGGL
ncbi:uncharacterized protein RHO25_007264 [Cercospora beticola]|uniref:Uncharacterized protein n=1 Tax=Cercospora beticola TaxID=122368 RepID=A0ABZ0NSR4_CERBT|nr:hypothetical protein RHO25_007264 [Cercospora beticola]